MRGLDQDKVDSALRLLVHVSAVQDQTPSESGGILVEDVVNTYPMEVVQAGADLFLEKVKDQNLEAFRVKWGCDETARMMEKQLWVNAATRWEEYVASMNERYLGFFLPMTYEGARIVTNWKLRKDLKWFSVEVPSHGWNVLRMMDDLTEVAWKLDLAFGYRPFGPDGVQGERVLLHKKAFESLKNKAVLPPEAHRTGIKLWKFFSEYDVEATDFVALMKECELNLDEVIGQVQEFFSKGLTSQYRDGQYPPYFVNEKMKKEFAAEVHALLTPMADWLHEAEVQQLAEGQSVAAPASAPESAPTLNN